jgi:hypothetical protein
MRARALNDLAGMLLDIGEQDRVGGDDDREEVLYRHRTR